MRIGELLHRDGLLGAEDLAVAIADQSIAKLRLCSLLIVRGVLEPDQVARALAEQHGVAAALAKHLDNRDKTLEKLLPANLARQHYALPIGRMRDGEIVICVRDPKPHSQAAFERILQKPVLITVAAAHTLEPLIEMTYPPTVTQDFGVRFGRPSSPPANVPQTPPAPQMFAAGTVRPQADGAIDEEIDIDMNSEATAMPMPMPEMMIPETFSLVDLDDAGVDKDFTQRETNTPVLPPGAGAPARQPTLPPLNVTRVPAKK